MTLPHHETILQDFLHDISSWFDDNGEGESQLNGEEEPDDSVKPVSREI